MFIKIYIVLIIIYNNLHIVLCENKTQDIIMSLGQQLEFKLLEGINNFTKYLEKYNDENFGNSEIGRFFNYEDVKPKIDGGRAAKSIKKMSTAMLPLIFHIGATSTWMLLTSLMAAKSVAIGLALLVFKIAVSSAKVASFFTTLKAKHSNHHHDWNWSPPPQMEYGHDRSLQKTKFNPTGDWHTYNPEWTPNDPPPPEYKSIPIYRNVNRDASPYDSVASGKNNENFKRK